jgi:hypothetical protein
MLLGTILSLVALICTSAVGTQVQTDKSQHKGVIYINPTIEVTVEHKGRRRTVKRTFNLSDPGNRILSK